jgi:predicted RNA-binding protein associated with RNAse of E/G family
MWLWPHSNLLDWLSHPHTSKRFARKLEIYTDVVIHPRCPKTCRTYISVDELAKAFRGELVPQDPADEPASALLARIRAEREAATRPTQATLFGGNGTNRDATGRQQAMRNRKPRPST